MHRDWAAVLLAPAVAVVAPAHAADYLTAAQAQKILFPDARSFVETPVTLSDVQKKQIRKLSGLRQRWDKQAVWRAEGPDGTLGWFIVDNVVGKHEYITYGAALSPEGKVIGIEIMSYRETHGDEVRRASWRQNFAGKTLGDQFKLDKDIPNISGATLSCRNLTDGVKRLLAFQQAVGLHD